MKLEVRYFHQKLPKLDYTDKEEYDYSDELMMEIIKKVMDVPYNVMIQTVKPSLGEGHVILWIDQYRFQQR